jgi:hypothetical protein
VKAFGERFLLAVPVDPSEQLEQRVFSLLFISGFAGLLPVIFGFFGVTH